MRTLRIFLALCSAAVIASCGASDHGTPTHVLKIEKWPPSGDLQTDTAGQTLPKPIRVKVTLDGETVAGYMVHFSGGLLGTDSMLTGADGIATSTWTLTGFTGFQFVTASLDSAVGSPLTFKATSVVGTPVAIEILSGDTQTVHVNNYFAQLVIKISDQFGNGVVGRWVYFSDSGRVTRGADSIISGDNGQIALNVHADAIGDTKIIAIPKDSLAGSPLVFSATIIP